MFLPKWQNFAYRVTLAHGRFYTSVSVRRLNWRRNNKPQGEDFWARDLKMNFLPIERAEKIVRILDSSNGNLWAIDQFYGNIHT